MGKWRQNGGLEKKEEEEQGIRGRGREMILFGDGGAE